MKVCSLCQKIYDDESLNFCLDCGGTLNQSNDGPPPTISLKKPRETNPNWQDQPKTQYQPFATNDPFKQQMQNSPAWTPPPAPIQGWQNQGLGANTPFQPPAAMMGVGQDQTLPIVSLVLGGLGFFLMCCYGGFPLGIAALVTGYLGMNNANKDPNQYGGKGLAIGGMVLGGLGIGITIFWILIVIISNLAK